MSGDAQTMKPRFRLSALLAGVVALGLIQAVPASAAITPQCQPLLAGQNIVAGSVCVTNDADYLSVTYTTVNGWTLDDLHLEVAQSLIGVPRTKNGNPIPGQFEYAVSLDGATTHTFQIPLADEGVNEPCDARTLVIAAHAVVKKVDGDGTVQTETGWANGTRFVARGNWATYFTYVTQCPPSDPLPCLDRIGTAFAFGDNDFKAAGAGGFGWSRWGWENTVEPGASLTRVLYRGGGSGPPTNPSGTQNRVGTVEINYSNGMLHVRVFTDFGFGLGVVHVRAENSSIVTLGSSGAAPGQYTVNGVKYPYNGTSYQALESLGGVNYFDFWAEVPDDDAGIFVTVHTEVGDLVACSQ